MRDISPSCPSKSNLALYNSISGSADGGGGGGAGARFGGGGGWRLVLLVVALVVDVEVMLGLTGADVFVFPGNG